MDENELVMIADNESTNGHPKVPTDNNVYPMYEERGGAGDARHTVICFDLPCVAGFTRSVSANLVIGASCRGRGGPLQGAMHGLEGLETLTVATAKAAPRGRGACPH